MQLGALAQCNWGLIKEKQRGGIDLAKAQCKAMGRPAELNLVKSGKIREATITGLLINDIEKLIGTSDSIVNRHQYIYKIIKLIPFFNNIKKTTP